MQLGRLSGLGEILRAVGQGCLAGRGEARPGDLLLALGRGLWGRSAASTPLLILSGGRGRSVVEGSYVPKLAELGVLCMPASFVTYQRPQRLMQVCLRHWAESQYWCQKWDLNHSWLGPVLNLGLCHWMSRISQGCQAKEAPWTERRTVATC